MPPPPQEPPWRGLHPATTPSSVFDFTVRDFHNFLHFWRVKIHKFYTRWNRMDNARKEAADEAERLHEK